MRPTPATTSKWWIVAGAVGALAVIFGAFAAHGLEALSKSWPEITRAARLEQWEVAARYHTYHALALCALATLASWQPSRWCDAAGSSFLAGVLLFSGCLYAYVLWQETLLVGLVPIGGALLIVGWCLLTIEAARRSLRPPAPPAGGAARIG